MAGRPSSYADWLERTCNNFKLVRFGGCLSVMWGSLRCLIFLEKSGPLDLPLVNREMLILILDQDRSLILSTLLWFKPCLSRLNPPQEHLTHWFWSRTNQEEINLHRFKNNKWIKHKTHTNYSGSAPNEWCLHPLETSSVISLYCFQEFTENKHKWRLQV